jgi:hypothetical protein
MNAHMTQPRRSIEADAGGSLFQRAFAETGKRFRRTGKLFRLMSGQACSNAALRVTAAACQSLIQRLVSAPHRGQR